MLFRSKPNIGHFRVWGCLAYVHIQKDKQAKLGPHMEKCIFIGYPDGYKGWKFYSPKTKKVIISERADFDERYTFGTISESGEIKENIQAQDYTPGPAIGNEDEQQPFTPAAPPAVEEQPAPVQPAIVEQPGPVQVPEQPRVSKTRQHAQIEPAQDDEDEPDNRPIAVRKPTRKAAGAGPVEWWKVCETTPAISSSDEDDDDEELEAVNYIGEADPAT